MVRMAGLVPNFTIRYPDLRTIGISLGSVGTYTHAYPDTTIAKNFFEIEKRIKAKTFELDYANTTYHSLNYSVDQVFGGSAIRSYENAKSEWQFDGNYHSKSGGWLPYLILAF
jgi:hypothetical protein